MYPLSSIMYFNVKQKMQTILNYFKTLRIYIDDGSLPSLDSERIMCTLRVWRLNSVYGVVGRGASVVLGGRCAVEFARRRTGIE